MALTRRNMLAATGAGIAASQFPIALAASAESAAEPLPQSTADRSLAILGPRFLEEDARAAMPEAAFEYVHGAAGDGWTMRRNEERLQAHAILPRRMGGFAEADTAATLLGRPVPAPIYVNPMGAQDFAHAEAELASVRGAARAGVPYALTSASNRPLEDVAKAAGEGALLMFAQYLNTDDGVNRALAERARSAGFRMIAMTVDSLGPGVSERFLRMGAPKTAQAGFGNFDPRRGGRGTFLDLRRDFLPADVGKLKAWSGLPVFVKGLLRPEDATRAVEAGADGIVVSNHGGRTFDGAPAAIDMLPAVVAAVGGRVPVWFDSGVRRGQDVIRALALGADAVGIGRPVLDALALGGASGVADLLDWFKRDLAVQMLQAGVRTVADITPDLVRIPA